MLLTATTKFETETQHSLGEKNTQFEPQKNERKLWKQRAFIVCGTIL
jgi:hypothetical protein